MQQQHLQPVDIASLKENETLIIGYANHSIPVGASPKWEGQEVKVVGWRRNPSEIKVEWKSGDIAHSFHFTPEHLYYPPSPQLRPIDLATIKGGEPVVIRQKGSKWDKAKGGVIAWDAIEGYILVAFGPKDRGIRFPASIVFHALETEPAPPPPPKKPFEVGEEVVTNVFDGRERHNPNFVDGMKYYVGQSGKITEYDGRDYYVHGYWWPASALERVPVKQEQPKNTIIDRAILYLQYSGHKEAAELLKDNDWCASDELDESTSQPSFSERMDEYFETQGKPFSLSDARQMYQQDGKAREIAKQWYSNEELERKDLPMSWEELPRVEGFIICSPIQYQLGGRLIIGAAQGKKNNEPLWEAAKGLYPTRPDAEAALAIAQLLQLRQAWLQQEVPGWVPDWDNPETPILVVRRNRYNVEVWESRTAHHLLSFPSEELAIRFLAAFPDLLRQAFCLPVEEKGGEG